MCSVSLFHWMRNIRLTLVEMVGLTDQTNRTDQTNQTKLILMRKN